MRQNEFMMALNALCTDKDLSKDIVFDAIETALKTAYRRDFEGDDSQVAVALDRTTGEARVFLEWKVVDEVEDAESEVTVEQALARFGGEPQLGEIVREERTPRNFGRIAAQTAKQVILQKLREAERDKQFFEFSSRESEIIVGTVQSVDGKSGAVRLSLGRAEAVLPRSEQIPGERYRIGQRVRAFVAEVSRATRGPQIVLSRTHKQMLRRLLELEVPEIANGTVEIRAIAREPGARSKVAVVALQAGVDPVGACVGMKGTRIQSIVNELNGEKIDVVQWSHEEAIYVGNSLSPAKVIETFLEESHEEGKTAIVVVPDRQLSLAIGKEGQNARLAAKLTGWRIDIKSASEASEERVRLAEREARRRVEEARRRDEEEGRREMARALLAEAEAALDSDAALAQPMSDVEALAFDEVAVPPPAVEVVPPVARELEQPVVPIAEPAAPESPPLVTIVKKADEQPAPAARPAPAPAAARPTPPPPPAAAPAQPSWEEAEEEEEEEEEEESSGTGKPSLIFYTLNERGEAESLGETMARKKKKKKKGESSSRGREWERGGGSSSPTTSPRSKDRGGKKGRGQRRPWDTEG